MTALLLDGPMGSCLGEAGQSLDAPLWSARALQDAPEAVLALHQAYARAGADVHTANSFRCQPHLLPQRWEELLALCVSLAKEGAQPGSRVAGSMAPVADCYRPDLSPANARDTHRAMAQGLLKQGVDLILCETFAHVGEGLVALEEALQTGLECWLSLCAGPQGQLMRPEALEEAAVAAAERGASAILFNCTAASMSAPYVQAMARSGLRFGVYANAGPSEEALGWGEQDGLGPERYCAHAKAWLEAGASIIGSCCGTRPAHTARLRTLIDERT